MSIPCNATVHCVRIFITGGVLCSYITINPTFMDFYKVTLHRTYVYQQRNIQITTFPGSFPERRILLDTITTKQNLTILLTLFIY